MQIKSRLFRPPTEPDKPRWQCIAFSFAATMIVL
jgi:hypothetical protein